MTRPAVQFDAAVREQVHDHVFGTLDREVGGVLLGPPAEDGPVRVTAAIAALEAESREASVTFTHDSWTAIYGRMEREHPGLDIVGWYHSHPGFGIFLSDLDLFIHRSFFADPRQVAHVVDPRRGTEGLFGWVDGEVGVLLEEPTRRRPAAEAAPASGPAPDGSSGRPASRRRPVVLAVALVAALAGAAAAATAGSVAGDEPAAPSTSRAGTAAELRRAQQRADDLEAEVVRLRARAGREPGRATPAQPRVRSYVVRRGDTLSGLALRFTGDAGAGWLLAGMNGIEDLDGLPEGRTLRVPDGGLRAALSPEPR